MNGYELSRAWFDFCFKNPHKVKPVHTALYFFAIEHCNRLGWKEIFGFPTSMAMDAIGVKSYKTYIAALNDLVDWEFLTMHERSRNQYSSNIIALVKNTNADTNAQSEALDKAISKHASKQDQRTVSIDKPNNLITSEPKNDKRTNQKEYREDFQQAWEDYGRKGSKKAAYIEWQKLSQLDKDTAMDHIPRYVEANEAEPHFMKDFERYLKHGTYHSTIIERPRKNTFSGAL